MAQVCARITRTAAAPPIALFDGWGPQSSTDPLPTWNTTVDATDVDV